MYQKLRVVRSTLSAEMLSLQEGIEEAIIYLRGIITEILSKKPETIPVVVYVDNKSVTQALSWLMTKDSSWILQVLRRVWTEMKFGQ